MKKTFVFCLLIISVTLMAQENFPDVHNVSTNFERIEIIRMKSGTDMLSGLNEYIEKNNIKNAVFLSGIGSVTDYHYHVVSSKTLPPKNEFTKAYNKQENSCCFLVIDYNCSFNLRHGYFLSGKQNNRR